MSNQVICRNLGASTPGHCLDIVVRRAEQDAAQPQEITWNLEIDNLTCPVREQLVGAHPAISEDIGRLSHLALADQIHSRSKCPAALINSLERSQLHLGKRNECAELSGKRRFNQGHSAGPSVAAVCSLHD